MTHFFTLSRILVLVAFRNLFLHKVKTLFMGGILTFGAFLFVFGLSLLTNIEKSMKDGIIHSVAGHLQIYSKDAKDSLALFGSGFMGKEDLGEIDDYAQLRSLLMKNANVQEVVPMGFETALLGRGNEADDQFDALRASLKTGDKKDIQEKIKAVRFYIANLKKEVLEQEKILSNHDHIRKSLNSIAETEKESFWVDLLNPQDREQKLQFLETKLAPISGEKPWVYLRYLGTDPQLFKKTFNKFHISTGEMIPEGQRGILISHKFSEDFLKMGCARKFDAIHRGIVKKGLKIEKDPELKRFAKELSLQHRPILMRLDKDSTVQVHNGLLEYFKSEHIESSPESSLVELLQKFLVVEDSNFLSRYNWFYKSIAPKLRLYEIAPGETIVLRSYTKSGYLKSVPVKVYGVYTFDGLEDSDIAGSFNILDMISFRELYGHMTEESLKETAQIKNEMKIKTVDKDAAEAEFFGESSVIEREVTHASDTHSLSTGPMIASKGIPENYDIQSLQEGLIINAAILLKDESLLKNTMKELQDSFSGTQMQIVDWKTASGNVGQFVEIIRYVLIFGVGIILLVALVIINNSFMVATFERSMEIGTMRAFGAQKSFVTGLFVMEAVALSLVSSLLGSILAFALLSYFHSVGIPSMHDVITFLFSGPRLYPQMVYKYLFIGPFIVTVLAGISSLYPALFAAKIPPAQAMQEKE